MKNTLLSLVALIVALPLDFAAAEAHQESEDSPVVWVDLTYIKLHDDIEIDEYIEKRGKLVERACENAIAAGHMLDWALYRVEEGEGYDLVSAKVSASLDGLAKVAGPHLETFLDDLSEAEREDWKRFETTKSIVHVETLWVESAIGSESMTGPMQARFLKAVPGKYWDYHTIGNDVFEKLHTAHVEAGRMTSWAFAGRYLPRGQASTYDFISFKKFPNDSAMEAMEALDDILDNANNALTADELKTIRSVEDLRTIVKQEIWRQAL